MSQKGGVILWWSPFLLHSNCPHNQQPLPVDKSTGCLSDLTLWIGFIGQPVAVFLYIQIYINKVATTLFLCLLSLSLLLLVTESLFLVGNQHFRWQLGLLLLWLHRACQLHHYHSCYYHGSSQCQLHIPDNVLPRLCLFVLFSFSTKGLPHTRIDLTIFKELHLQCKFKFNHHTLLPL